MYRLRPSSGLGSAAALPTFFGMPYHCEYAQNPAVAVSSGGQSIVGQTFWDFLNNNATVGTSWLNANAGKVALGAGVLVAVVLFAKVGR